MIFHLSRITHLFSCREVKHVIYGRDLYEYCYNLHEHYLLHPVLNHLHRGHNDGNCLFSRNHATTDLVTALPKLLIGAGLAWLALAQPVQLIKVYIT